MVFLMVIYILSTLTKINSNTVSSPQIRILDMATKASESRLIPHRIDYRNAFHPYFQQQNHYEQTTTPLKSYVIYDEYPVRTFKEWKANPPTEFPLSAPQKYEELKRQQNVEFPSNYYLQNEQQSLPLSKPTLAYRSVYSNVIKVFDNSWGDFDPNRFQNDRYTKPFERGVWKTKNPIEYEPIYPSDVLRRPLNYNFKLPENFPIVFSSNEKFHFPSFDEAVPPPMKFFFPKEGFYNTYTINYNKETARNPEEVEILPEMANKQKNQRKTFLCSFIKVNQRQFPKNGGPCARSDENLPLFPPEYPDYSGLPNYKIPVEHRRQHFQMKRIKRSEPNHLNESRKKRNAGLGYGYGGWGSPFGYDNGYDGYYSSNYPSSGGYRNNYNFGYSSNRNRNQGYRNRYYGGSRYDDYDEDYQNNDDSNSKGLTSYLTNGGRRYKNRKNNNDDEDEDDDDNENSNNNREDDSDEEMERMNSNRRDTNERRNNDDSRDRRRNNNSNDDDEYRDNRRNNNRNNNSKRYNNNNSNNNNSNSNRRYNDRNDNNNNRNRYYGNSNGYNNNGYGSSYGSYGSNYGGSYGNGGYGSGYGSNGGYGYGGYGNGFGSF